MDEDLRSRYRSQPAHDRPVQPARQAHPRPTVMPQPRPAYTHHPRPQPRPSSRPQIAPMPRANFEEHNYPAVDSRGRTKRKSKKTWFIIASLIIIMGLAAAGWFLVYPKYSNPNPFPASIQKSATMSLFYPGKMPAGYIVDKNSIHTANGAVIYYANNGNKRLVFTSQKTPPNFDFNAFYRQQLKTSTDFNTQYGEVVIGKNDNRYLGSLSANNTWLLLSTNSPEVSLNDMSLVLHNLNKY